MVTKTRSKRSRSMVADKQKVDFLAAKGQWVQVRYGKKPATLRAGQPGRVEIDGHELVVQSGKVRFANGQEAFAVLEFDESSSGEHGGTGIILPGGGLTFQGDADFCEKLGLTAEEVFPYAYMYFMEMAEEDIHASVNQWSR